MSTTEVQSLIEVLTTWFEGHSITIVSLKVHAAVSYQLFSVSGTFEGPAVFDEKYDGAELKLDYMYELERKDDRFRFTEIIFISNTEFVIKYAK